ncbi:MAG: hypothetical protein ACRDF4_04170, partial [Rhabdochlamydiaceae bacterium]
SLMRDLCLQQRYKRLLKKWAIAGLMLLAFATSFFIGYASAQEEITIFSGDQPLVLPNENPAIIQQQVGTFLHGTIRGAITANCTLQNCMTQNDFNGVEFSGQMPAYRAEIQTPQSTIVFEPFDNMPDWLAWIETNVGYLVAIGVILLVVLAVWKLVVRSNRNNRGWRI